MVAQLREMVALNHYRIKFIRNFLSTQKVRTTSLSLRRVIRSGAATKSHSIKAV